MGAALRRKHNGDWRNRNSNNMNDRRRRRKKNLRYKLRLKTAIYAFLSKRTLNMENTIYNLLISKNSSSGK
jgi:predicted SprT family Zn-dependent metalloprotease